MKAILIAALLLSTSLLMVPSATAAGPCEGAIPATQCYARDAVNRCTPPMILSQCYGPSIGATLDYVIYLCDLALGPGKC